MQFVVLWNWILLKSFQSDFYFKLSSSLATEWTKPRRKAKNWNMYSIQKSQLNHKKRTRRNETFKKIAVQHWMSRLIVQNSSKLWISPQRHTNDKTFWYGFILMSSVFCRPANKQTNKTHRLVEMKNKDASIAKTYLGPCCPPSTSRKLMIPFPSLSSHEHSSSCLHETADTTLTNSVISNIRTTKCLRHMNFSIPATNQLYSTYSVRGLIKFYNTTCSLHAHVPFKTQI